MKNAFKGAVLGAVNAFGVAIAVTLTIAPPRPHVLWTPVMSEMLGAIVLIALVSAIPLGAILGAFAGKLRANRLVVLELVTLALLPLCGIVSLRATGMQPRSEELFALVAMAACPTVFSVIALERWTRPAAPIPRALQLRAS
jgi:hypothetical protein